MRKAEKIPHIHLPHVSQSGFNAKVNVLTFGKLQDNFFFCFQLFQFYTMITTLTKKRKKKEKKERKKKGGEGVQDLFYQCPKNQELVPIVEN